MSSKIAKIYLVYIIIFIIFPGTVKVEKEIAVSQRGYETEGKAGKEVIAEKQDPDAKLQN